MSDPEEEAWRLYVRDMIEFAEQAIAYATDLDQQAFIADRRTYDATLRNIELLGEAAPHVPEPVHDAHPQNRVAEGHRDQESTGSRLHGYR